MNQYPAINIIEEHYKTAHNLKYGLFMTLIAPFKQHGSENYHESFVYIKPEVKEALLETYETV